MRKQMQREVTFTTVKVAKMEVKNGLPVAVPLEEIKLLGNVSAEKAQKEVQKAYDFPVTVFERISDTKRYTMDIEKFIELADIEEDQITLEENE